MGLGAYRHNPGQNTVTEHARRWYANQDILHPLEEATGLVSPPLLQISGIGFASGTLDIVWRQSAEALLNMEVENPSVDATAEDTRRRLALFRFLLERFPKDNATANTIAGILSAFPDRPLADACRKRLEKAEAIQPMLYPLSKEDLLLSPEAGFLLEEGMRTGGGDYLRKALQTAISFFEAELRYDLIPHPDTKAPAWFRMKKT